ncbi:histone-lysine N-methyltransferase SETMAR [Trichonephila clavipes]|nr:histone-lysine N-methyltransferase SETMAR [Trichonephila clavipes]
MVFVFLVIFSVGFESVEMAGSCKSYGHSCLGGHGKRNSPPLFGLDMLFPQVFKPRNIFPSSDGRIMEEKDVYNYPKGPFSCELQGVKNGSQQRQNSVHFTVFFDKGENTSQVTEIVNGVYGADTVTANYMHFWFHRFFQAFLMLKMHLAQAGPSLIITEIIDFGWHVSSRSIAQELKIDYKTVLNHLCKVELKKKLPVWVPHQLTPKNTMDRISICNGMKSTHFLNGW